jgi:ribosomal protein S18 acetylase RimI-like enzyme
MDSTAAAKVVDVAFSPMRECDIRGAMDLLSESSYSAYHEWENEELLRKHLRDNSDLCLVAKSQMGLVVGVLIGGSVGVRGTISHIAVDSQWQRMRIGSRMVARALDSFAARGLYRVFLFAIPGNASAAQFWELQGFADTSPERTYEIDLPYDR